jgi:hypothetical protein
MSEKLNEELSLSRFFRAELNNVTGACVREFASSDHRRELNKLEDVVYVSEQGDRDAYKVELTNARACESKSFA